MISSHVHVHVQEGLSNRSVVCVCQWAWCSVEDFHASCIPLFHDPGANTAYMYDAH